MEQRPSHARSYSRRELLKMAPLACAGMLLHANSREWMLSAGLRMTDAASALAFRPSVLAPTFPEEDVTPFHRFPINSYLTGDFEVDLDTWRLEVSGLVRQPGAYTLASIRGFPKIMQNTRHICIEGWDVIGNFAGTRVDDFLTRVGADPSARFLEVEGATLHKPVQLSWLATLLGGFRLARVWHFAAMCGLLAFISAHVRWSRSTGGAISPRCGSGSAANPLTRSHRSY